MQNRKTISAKELARDIKAGLPDGELMKKYGISHDSLTKAFDKLVSAGILTQEEVQKTRGPRAIGPHDYVKCPSCGLPQPRLAIECANCGVIMAKMREQEALEESKSSNVREPGVSEQRTGGFPWLAIGITAVVVFAISTGVWMFMSGDRPRANSNVGIEKPVGTTNIVKERGFRKQEREDDSYSCKPNAIWPKIKKGIKLEEVENLLKACQKSQVVFVKYDEVKAYPNVGKYIKAYEQASRWGVGTLDRDPYETPESRKAWEITSKGQQPLFVRDANGIMHEPEIFVWTAPDGACLAIAFMVKRVAAFDLSVCQK
jgi:hypothetical protein